MKRGRLPLTAKSEATANHVNAATGSTPPRAERPRIPAIYGVPSTREGLLEWSYVEQRMEVARCYWVATTSAAGLPHATPVDGLWIDGILYFGGSPQTRRHRNLAENPAVCVHLESGTEVVILHGVAQELRSPPRELVLRLAQASEEKYGWGMNPKQIAAGGTFAFRVRIALAWKQFPKDVTRWTLQ